MSRFPRIYAESTINRMYRKLDLSEEAIHLLHDYFNALSNYYHRISLKDTYDIINKQNENMLTEEQFLAFSEIARHESHYYFILGYEELYKNEPPSKPIDRELVHECLVVTGFDSYYQTVEVQQGKPLYIPEKSKLLLYKNEDVFLKIPLADKLRKFFRNRLRLDHETADDMTFECVLELHMTQDTDFVENLVSRMTQLKIIMNPSQLEEFVALIVELNNNLPTPYNRGFSPKMLSEYFRKTVDPKELCSALKNGEITNQEFFSAIAGSQLMPQIITQMKRNTTSVEKTKKTGRNDFPGMFEENNNNIKK